MNTLATRPESTPLIIAGGQTAPANDAFSFWKLPQAWRGALASSVAHSRVIAEWYLRERYRETADRDSDLSMRMYYAVKRLHSARDPPSDQVLVVPAAHAPVVSQMALRRCVVGVLDRLGAAQSGPGGRRRRMAHRILARPQHELCGAHS